MFDISDWLNMVAAWDARQVGLYLPDGSPAGTGLKEK